MAVAFPVPLMAAIEKKTHDYQCIKKLMIMQDESMIIVTSHVQNAHQWRLWKILYL